MCKFLKMLCYNYPVKYYLVFLGLVFYIQEKEYVMNFFISEKNLAIYATLFVIAAIAGIIVGCRVSDGGVGLYTTLAIMTFGLLPFVKRIVLFIGRKVIDFASTVDLVIVMSILVFGIFYKANSGYFGQMLSYWWFVLAAFLYLVYAALKNYVLYLLIDIRDSLHKLAHGDKESINDNTDDSNSIEDVPEDSKYCPYCGKIIKKIAKKCRYCGEWLNNENSEVSNEENN